MVDDKYYRLTYLVTLALDGGLDDAGYGELSEILKNDAGAREVYYGLLMVETGVKQLGDCRENTEAFEQDFLRDYLSYVLKDKDGSDALLGFKYNSVESFCKGDSGQGEDFEVKRASRFSNNMALVYLAAMFALIFGVVWAYLGYRGNEMGSLSRCLGVSWAGSPASEGDKLTHERMVIEEGVAELSLADGVKVIVKGPSAFQVEASNQLYLHYGNLVARIDEETEDDYKFVVRTPRAVVTDLGTEFGVSVLSSGETKVHVFQGLVELYNSSELGRFTQRILMEAGQGVGVDLLGNLARQKVSDDNFVRMGDFDTLYRLENNSGRPEVQITESDAGGIVEISERAASGKMPVRPADARIEAFKIAAMSNTYDERGQGEIALEDQVKWVLDNIDRENISFVCHLGDIVCMKTATSQQWREVSRVMESFHSTLGVSGKAYLPYSVGLGDRDLDVRDNKYGGFYGYYQYFGPGRYKDFEWFGGADRKGGCNYQLFTAGGRMWLHLNMEVYADDESLKWAQDVIDCYAGMPVIYSTHSYLQQGQEGCKLGEAMFNGDGLNGGKAQWYKFVGNNDQIVMVLCSSGDAERKSEAYVSVNIYGRPVLQINVRYPIFSAIGKGGFSNIEVDEPSGKVDVADYFYNGEKYVIKDKLAVDFDWSARLCNFGERQCIGHVELANLEVDENQSQETEGRYGVRIGVGQGSENFRLHETIDRMSESNYGDYAIQIGDFAWDDSLGGVTIACSAENGRDNGRGGKNYHTVSASPTKMGSQLVSVHKTSGKAYMGGEEGDVDCGVAYFPFSGGWLGGHLQNLDNNLKMCSLTANENIVMDKHLRWLGGEDSVVKPMSGGNMRGEGIWELALPGVDSLSDGVLMVCGGKNEDNYASTGIKHDGSGWLVAVRDNGFDGSGTEQDPFNFVYIPYGTEGVTAGVITGCGGILNGTGDFSVRQTVGGEYRLEIDEGRPGAGVLLVNGSIDGYAMDNIVTYEGEGDGWLVQSRDLPNAVLQGMNSVCFTFAYIRFDGIPSGPGRSRARQREKVACGDFEVFWDAGRNMVNVGVRGSSNYMSVCEFDYGDYGIYVNGFKPDFMSGVLLASAREDFRQDEDGVYLATVSTGYTNWVHAHRSAEAEENAEFNVNFSAAWFPYAGDFTAGHIDGDGEVACSNGAIPFVISHYEKSPGRYLLALNGLSTSEGLLFVISEGNTDNVASASPQNDFSWEVAVRDNSPALAWQSEAGMFGYLYLPYSVSDYRIARISGAGKILDSNGGISSSRTATGVYKIRVENGSSEEGVLLVNSYGLGADGPVNALVSYQVAGRDFVVKCFDSSTKQAMDTDLAVGYVAY